MNEHSQSYVLATVIGTAGSTPRNIGSKMVIGVDRVFDTIGGGNLEYQVMAEAQALLTAQSPNHQQMMKHFPLSASVGQCCGGSVSVLLEYFPAQGVNLALFGAGHVGKALVNILSGLPCQVQWIDSRESEFPPLNAFSGFSNITPVINDYPVDEVMMMPAGSFYLVMTHNHQLDFELCAEILKRDNFAYLGLIASQTKWKRFQQKLSQAGCKPEQIQRISSPVGLPEIAGKKPMEVAVSIAAEVIQHYQHNSAEAKHQGIGRAELNQFNKVSNATE